MRVLPQTPIALPADERVVDWLRAQAALDEGAARTLLGAFALDTAAVHRPLGRLSPGERARVHMAAMVASGAELLLLDEPTNHLDPETLEAVEAALRAFAGTIVAVSHDRAFLEGLGVTRRIEVRDGEVRELGLRTTEGPASTPGPPWQSGSAMSAAYIMPPMSGMPPPPPPPPCPGSRRRSPRW